MAFVFEGDLDLGAVKLNLAVADSHVLRHDLRYAQLAQMFSGLLNHVLGSVFPAFGASADEFDNVVNALGMDNLVTTLGHERISSSTNTLPPSTDSTPKMTFCPAETGLFTRPVAFILAGDMAVAYFMAHAPKSFFPTVNGGQLAILFCFVFLFLVFAGGGVWSADEQLRHSRTR